MKKFFVLLFLLTLGLYGCTSSQSSSTIPQKDAVGLPMQLNGYITSRLDVPLEPEYRFSNVFWIDDERIIVVEEKYEDQNGTTVPHKKIFIYNRVEKTRNLLFDGILYGDIRVKNFQPSIIGLQSDNKYFVVDITKLRIIKEIGFPQEFLEKDVSPDGTKLVYRTSDGLYISDINNIVSSTLVHKLQQGIGPVSPRWSSDNKIIYNNYLDSKVIVNVIDNNLKKLKEYTVSGSDRVQAYWLPHNMGFVVYRSNGQSLYRLDLVKISSDNVITIQEDGPMQVQDIQGNILLYSAFDSKKTSFNMIHQDLQKSQKQP